MVTAFHLFDKDFHWISTSILQLLGLQALYRRASAKQSLGDLDGAMEDLKSACELFGKPRFEQKGGGRYIVGSSDFLLENSRNVIR